MSVLYETPVSAFLQLQHKIFEEKVYKNFLALVWTHLLTTNFPAGNGCPAHGPSSGKDFVKTTKT
jgi:hypothetical protein